MTTPLTPAPSSSLEERALLERLSEIPDDYRTITPADRKAIGWAASTIAHLRGERDEAIKAVDYWTERYDAETDALTKRVDGLIVERNAREMDALNGRLRADRAEAREKALREALKKQPHAHRYIASDGQPAISVNTEHESPTCEVCAALSSPASPEGPTCEHGQRECSICDIRDLRAPAKEPTCPGWGDDLRVPKELCAGCGGAGQTCGSTRCDRHTCPDCRGSGRAPASGGEGR